MFLCTSVKHGPAGSAVDSANLSIVIKHRIPTSALAYTPRTADFKRGLPAWAIACTLLSLHRSWTPRIDHSVCRLRSHRLACNLNITLGFQKRSSNIRHSLPLSTLSCKTISQRQALPTPITLCLINGHPTSSMAFPRCLYPEHNGQPISVVAFKHHLWTSNNGQPMTDMANTHCISPAHKD